MKLWQSLLGRGVSDEQRHGDLFNQFGYKGVSYPILGGSTSPDRESVEDSFVGYVRQVYKSNGVVFACMTARQMLFSEARFMWQRLDQGRPGDLFGNRELSILEQPWPNATTGELLSRMIQDVDLAGNFYAARERGRLRRLRPDWVEIVLTAPPDQAVESDVAGYAYWPGGKGSGSSPQPYLPSQVASWAPIPDPEAQYKGMSWLTPVLREIEADAGATLHKKRFFDNAATPNLAVSFSETVTKEQFDEFMESLNEQHQGAHNAYRTLYLGGGADVTVLGRDMAQLDFKVTQGAGETRIAAAARVHPVVVGLSEGMQGSSLNAGNFNSAKRSFADGTMRPLWRGASGALETVVPPPSAARLWVDTRDIQYLQEDRKDIAEIQRGQAQAIRQLTDAGYEPDSVVSAVQADNLTLLEHTGLFSVQLHPPGSDEAGDGGDPPDGGTDPDEGEDDADAA